MFSGLICSDRNQVTFPCNSGSLKVERVEYHRLETLEVGSGDPTSPANF